MGFYAKKTLLGFREVSEKEADYVVETIEEFESDVSMIQQFRREKAAAEKHAIDLKKEYDDLSIKQFEEYLEQSDRDVKYAQKKAQEKYDALAEEHEAALQIIKKIQEENRILSDEVERNKSLNRHFKRVSKERANRENEQPKKEGSGYVVLTTGQCRDRVPDPDVQPGWEQNDIFVNVYKTVIRTHYDASLPLKDIQPEIRRELIDCVLGPMGIERIIEHSKNGEYRIWIAEDDTERTVNGVYRWSYKANFMSGYWEIEIYHNEPVYVTADFRIMKNQSKKRGGENHTKHK